MATARVDVDGGAGGHAHARVEALLRRHHGALMWVARRWAGTADDAEDALQRALEIYVRRLDTVDPATELAWLKVVVRHEALALRRARATGVPLDEDDLAARLPAPEPAVQERIEREERNALSLQALARLKPDERTALLLKAQGFSYREIGERQGWTYTKVNRAITEGRRRFLRVFAALESGEECERYAPTLLALAEGGAEAAQVVALRPHLRHCGACRATVRELVDARRHRLALHLPLVAGAAPLRWLGGRIADGTATDALAGGAGAGGGGGGADVKGFVGGLLNRLPGPDAATSMQLASSGGGRGTAVAALLSLCLGGGAGTYCVATGVLPDPVRIVRGDGDRDERRSKPARDRDGTRARDARAAQEPAAPTPTPTPIAVAQRPVITPAPPRTEPSTPKSRPRSERRDRRDRRSDPAPEFGFEGATGSPGVAPPAPSAPAATTSTTTTAPPASSAGGSTQSSSPPPTSGGEFLP